MFFFLHSRAANEYSTSLLGAFIDLRVRSSFLANTITKVLKTLPRERTIEIRRAGRDYVENFLFGGKE